MKFLASSFVALVAAAGLASATPVTTVTAKLVNAGSPVITDSDGNDVGPYTLSINGVKYSALCVDFSDESWVNETWQAYESPLNGSLANTYLPSDSKQYKEEAYLLSLILQPGADRTDIQHAAWAITDPWYWANSAAQQYINLAQANYSTVNTANFDIISDVDQDCYRAQEFIIEPSANAPEPASLLLVAGGLIAAGLARRKRIAQK